MLPDIAQWSTALGVGAPLIVAGALLLVLGTRSTLGALRRSDRQLDEALGQLRDERQARMEAERRASRAEHRASRLEDELMELRPKPWLDS